MKLGTRMLLLCHHNRIESEVHAVEADICTDNRAQYYEHRSALLNSFYYIDKSVMV